MKPEDKRAARIFFWLALVFLISAYLAVQWDWPLWSKIVLIVLATFSGMIRISFIWGAEVDKEKEED